MCVERTLASGCIICESEEVGKDELGTVTLGQDGKP